MRGSGQARRHRERWEAGVLAAMVVIAYAVLLVLPYRAALAVPDEDGLVQYVGAGGFLAASVFFLILYIRMRRAHGGGLHRKDVVVLVLAGLFFFAAGEEISWGQRIFGIATPEAISQVNRQDETTLHNMQWMPIGSYRLFTLVWIPFVLVVPLIASRSLRAGRLFDRWLPLAAWPVGLVYVVNEVAQKAAATLGDRGVGAGVVVTHARVELRETVFALLCAFTAYSLVRAQRMPISPSAAGGRTHAGTVRRERVDAGSHVVAGGTRGDL